jgi:hypothetical protein
MKSDYHWWKRERVLLVKERKRNTDRKKGKERKENVRELNTPEFMVVFIIRLTWFLFNYIAFSLLLIHFFTFCYHLLFLCKAGCSLTWESIENMCRILVTYWEILESPVQQFVQQRAKCREKVGWTMKVK